MAVAVAVRRRACAADARTAPTSTVDARTVGASTVGASNAGVRAVGYGCSVTHAEFEITADVVRDLLRDQHPDLADRPVRLGARGWDNQLWRLGDDLAVRLPWATQSADGLLLKEHAWVPALAPRLPLPVPVPQRLGAPSERYPRPWIVTTWVRGEPADRAPVTRGAAAADALAAFLSALHQPAPAGRRPAGMRGDGRWPIPRRASPDSWPRPSSGG